MAIKGAGHLHTRKGKRVLVFMKNGDHFVAKFLKTEGKWVEFYDHERVAAGKVRTVSILKQRV